MKKRDRSEVESADSAAGSCDLARGPVEGKDTPPVERRMSTDSPLPPGVHLYSVLVIGLWEGPLFVVLLVKEPPLLGCVQRLNGWR